jgi:ABC-type transport system substrate-binding protein
LLRVERGEADWTADGLRPTAYADLAKKYGVNRKNGQLQIFPEISILYLAMNNSYGSNSSQPIFKGNAPLRKAVNFAVNRKLIVAQRGFGGGQPADQVLAPGVAGFKHYAIYPNTPNLTKAKKLATGHTRDKKVVFYFRNNSTGPPIAAVVQDNLTKLGLNVVPTPLPRGIQIKKEGTRGEPFDMTLEGWVADYPDPYDFIDVLLNGSNIKADNNNNVAYFNDPKYNARMHHAETLVGAKRYATYRKLDLDISKNAAPWASYANAKNRDFFSSRIGCYMYHPVFLFDLARACLK